MAYRLAPVIFVCLWATGFVGARMGMPHGEPASFLTFRYVIAFFVLAIICILWRAPWPKGRDLVNTLIVGALVHGVYLGCVFWAVRNGMPGGVAAIVVGLQPLLTAVLAGSWLREYVGPRQWLGLLVGLVGISLVLLPKLEFGNEGITPITIGVCLISVVGMTLGTVFQKKYGGMSDLRTGTAMQYVGALVPTFIFAAMFESFAIDWNGQALFALFWLVFVLSIAAVFLLMWLIREGSVSQVSSLFYLVPAVATLMTWYLFDEQLNLIQISGMVLCALAVALGAAKPKVAGKEA